MIARTAEFVSTGRVNVTPHTPGLTALSSSARIDAIAMAFAATELATVERGLLAPLVRLRPVLITATTMESVLMASATAELATVAKTARFVGVPTIAETVVAATATSLACAKVDGTGLTAP